MDIKEDEIKEEVGNDLISVSPRAGTAEEEVVEKESS